MSLSICDADFSSGAFGYCDVFQEQPPADNQYFVKPTATGTGDGSSWDNAASLSQALQCFNSPSISPSCSGTVELWLLGGTYDEFASVAAANRYLIDLDNFGNNLQIYGGFDESDTTREERDPSVNVTIIKANNKGVASPFTTFLFNGDPSESSFTMDGVTVEESGRSAFAAVFATTQQSVQMVFQFRRTIVQDSEGAGSGVDDYGQFFLPDRVRRLNFVTLADCVFQDNRLAADHINARGFAINLFSPSPLTGHVLNLINCKFLSNIVTSNANVGIGGLISVARSELSLMNCLFANNSIVEDVTLGNGASCISCNTGSNICISNCTFADNASRTTLFFIEMTSTIAQRNSIVYNNTVGTNFDVRVQGGATLLLEGGNIIENGITTFSGGSFSGVFTTNDPLFVSSANNLGSILMEGDYHLLPTSPAIQAGDNAFVPFGVTRDLDCQQRIVGNFVDLGVYEDQNLYFWAKATDNGVGGFVFEFSEPVDGPQCLPYSNGIAFVDGSSVLDIAGDQITLKDQFTQGTNIVLVSAYDSDAPSLDCIDGTEVSSGSIPGSDVWELPNSVSNTYNCFEVLLCFNGTPPAPCVHGDTLVHTLKGLVPIRDIRSGDKVLTHDDRVVDIVYNIRIQTRGAKFVRFAEDTIGNDHPLLVRRGHPLLVDGQEHECQDLINDDTITWYERNDVYEVYTLATNNPDGDFVVMQGGAYVKAWDAQGFDRYLRSDRVGKTIIHSKR